jgi:hypothetical protein
MDFDDRVDLPVLGLDCRLCFGLEMIAMKSMKKAFQAYWLRDWKGKKQIAWAWKLAS